MIWTKTYQNTSSNVRSFNTKHITFNFYLFAKNEFKFISDGEEVLWLITYHSNTQLMTKAFFLPTFYLYYNLQNYLSSWIGKKLYWKQSMSITIRCRNIIQENKGKQYHIFKLCLSLSYEKLNFVFERKWNWKLKYWV